MSNRRVAWDEPMYWDPPHLTRFVNLHQVVSEEDAVAFQRGLVEHRNPGFRYESDEQALDDFMTVRWAYFE